ncbi:unnamed protein product [Lota lota]
MRRKGQRRGKRRRRCWGLERNVKTSNEEAACLLKSRAVLRVWEKTQSIIPLETHLPSGGMSSGGAERGFVSGNESISQQQAMGQALKTAMGQVSRPVGAVVLVVQEADTARSEAISLSERRS